MSQNKKVYTIIVTYNAMRWIDKCLMSLRQSDCSVYTVIIDNLSTDNTVHYVKENYPEVTIIENKENRGFGQANNQGIELAYKQGATHFFLLNQDAWVHKDTINRLVATQDAFDLAVVSPIHLNGEGDAMDYGFFAATILKSGNCSFASDAILKKYKDYYEVNYINAAAWILSRRCVESIGGFDPTFFHYGEDRNYCQRLKYHNEKIVFVPEAYIHHDRIYHGNETVYNKRYTATKLLSLYSNINVPFIKISLSRLKLHAMFFVNSLKALLTLRFDNFRSILSGYMEFFRLLPMISHARKENVQKKANWLKLL